MTTMAKPELTATQRRTRTRLLTAGAVAFTLVLGFVVIAADVTRTPNRTDAPFWSRLWQGAKDQLHAAGDALAKIQHATQTPDQETQALSKEVFPQFDR